MLRAYFGHHKCASTWIWQIIHRVCRDAGRTPRLFVDAQTPTGKGLLTDYHQSEIPRSELGEYVAQEGIDFATCIAADAAQVQSLGNLLGFHVVRDPRDVIVSGYFSHRNTHPTEGLSHLQDHREKLRSVSKEEGLFLEMEYAASAIEDMASWDYDQPNILEVKMEDLTAAPYESFVRIFEFLDLMSWEGESLMRDRIRVFVRSALNRLSLRHPALDVLRTPIEVTGGMLLGQVYDQRFEKHTGGREKGVEDRRSHYRKGKAGDWINHLTKEHLKYFDDRFGDVLVRLGYEPTRQLPAVISGDGLPPTWEHLSVRA